MVKCDKKDSNNSCRSFKIVASTVGYKSPKTSYYKNKEPFNAAKKFGTMLFKIPKNKNENNIKIIIKDCTRGSNNDLFEYELIRKKLPTPIERIFINKEGQETEYVITTKVHVTALEDDDTDILRLKNAYFGGLKNKKN
jgi:hypothetical protein